MVYFFTFFITGEGFIMCKTKTIKIIAFIVLQFLLLAGIAQAAEDVVSYHCLAPVLHLNSQSLQNVILNKQATIYSPDEVLALPAASWISLVAKRLTPNDLLNFLKIYQLYEVKFGNQTYEQSFNRIYPSFYDRMLAEYDLAFTTTRLQQIKDHGGLNYCMEQAEKNAKTEFASLQNLTIFKQGLSSILRSYLKEAGQEEGRIFTKSGKSLLLEKKAFTSLVRTNKEKSICSVHTHCAAFAEISNRFFAPSGQDIINAFSTGDENVGILWGDMKRGFYLTVVNMKRAEIAVIIHQFVRDGKFAYDEAKVVLDAWVDNVIETFDYYKLKGEGAEDEYGVFGQYSLIETDFPQELAMYYHDNNQEIVQQLIDHYKKIQRQEIIDQIDQMLVVDAIKTIMKAQKLNYADVKRSFKKKVEALLSGDTAKQTIYSLELKKFEARQKVLFDFFIQISTTALQSQQKPQYSKTIESSI
jgi:hypothetical protein